jgi:putative solute:sodium symporter small subunit
MTEATYGSETQASGAIGQRDAPAPSDALGGVTSTPVEPFEGQAERAHWRRIKRLTGWLLLLWMVVTFVTTYYARDLAFTFFGWPFSYWMAAQGSLFVYLFITVAYAWLAHRLDGLYGLEEGEP